MSNNGCIFCKIVTGQIPCTKIWEDEVAFAFLDIGPVSDGHTLVVSKQHFEKLHDCPTELLGRITSGLGMIAEAVTSAVGADGYNILCNNGRVAGQLVGHLHFHIIPRNSGDGLFNRWPSYQYEQGKIEQLGEKIRQRL